MEKENKTLYPGITSEMVSKAKAKWGDKKIRTAECGIDEDTDDVLVVLLRRPNRQVMNEYVKWADKSPAKADEILVNSCLLSHKEEVKANEFLFGNVVDAISQIIPTPRKAVVKEI
ncbi:hypothetical protein D3C72_1718680 [compost metagenome]